MVGEPFDVAVEASGLDVLMTTMNGRLMEPDEARSCSD
jgi:hypothetical protein